jgi:hypothetical protein
MLMAEDIVFTLHRYDHIGAFIFLMCRTIPGTTPAYEIVNGSAGHKTYCFMATNTLLYASLTHILE